MEETEPIELPIDGVLDLHTFRPADVKDLVPEYLAECRKRGIYQARIIHGKGIGALRETVHAILRRLPEVEGFGLAPAEAGLGGDRGEPPEARLTVASRDKHCADCRRELGEPFEHVHEWLDALFKVLRQKHRSARHHRGGVEKVRRMWGDRAARAAEIHIKADCGGIVPEEKDAQP